MRFILFLFCFSIGLSFIPAQSKDTIFPLWMNRRYALVRSAYPNLITPPLYKDVDRIGPGIFSAKKDDLYGILDTSGKEIIKMEYPKKSSEWDPITKKNYTLLYKSNESILIDDQGKIIGKNYPEIKGIYNGLVIVQPDPRDSLMARLYYAGASLEYYRQGLMDLKGNWIQKPSDKYYDVLYNSVIGIVDLKSKPIKGRLYDLKLNPISTREFLGADAGSDLKDDSLEKLKRIIVYDHDTLWILDSTGKELEKKFRKVLDVKVYEAGVGPKGFSYLDDIIVECKYDDVLITKDHLIGYDSTAQKTDIYDRRGNFLFTKNYSKTYTLTTTYGRPKKEPEYVFARNKTGIYVLNSKFEKQTPALRSVTALDSYYDDDYPLFLCEQNKKYCIIDQSGKFIVPFYSGDRPYHSSGVIAANSIIKGKYTTVYYTFKGEELIKGADEVTQCKIDPSLYIVKIGSQTGIYNGKPLKPAIALNTYSSFDEYADAKVIVAKQNEKMDIFDKDLSVLNKEAAIRELFTTDDSVTFIVKLVNGKGQLLSYRSHRPKNSFDRIQTFQSFDKNPLFMVTNNSKYGLINLKSDLLLNTEWDTIVGIGNCAVVRKGRSYFVTNSKFEVDRNMPLDSIVIYKDFYSYNEDNDWRSYKIQTKKGGKWGVFDLVNHKWAVYPYFENVVTPLGKTNYSQRYYATTVNKWTYLVDPEKNILLGEGFNEIEHIASDVFRPWTEHAPNLRVNKGNASRDSLGKIKGGKYGIMDPKGKMLHKCDADKIWPISYQIYPREGMVGYVWNVGGTIKKFISRHGDSIPEEITDEKGNIRYKNVLRGREYGETMAGGKFGIVGVNGKEIFPAIYDDMIFKFYGGEGIGNYRASYLDTLPKYDHLIFPIHIKKDGKWGVGEFNGKIIAPFIYDSVEDEYLAYDQPAMRLVSNGNIGYVDLQGKEIIPVTYSGEQRFGNYYNQPELILFQKNGITNTYTVEVLSSTMTTRYYENGNKYYVDDTISVQQKNYSGGTYGFWDMKKNTWALEPVYEDIRLLQIFTTLSERQIPKRTSVTGKYPDQCDHFIKDREPFEIKKNGKWGLYFYGKGIVLQTEYDEIKIQGEEVIAIKAGVEKHFSLEGVPK